MTINGVHDQKTTPNGEPAAQTARPARFRLPGPVRDALPALGGYVAVRLVGLSFLYLMATRVDPRREPMPSFPASIPFLLNRADGNWYVRLAADGYDTSVQYVDGALVNTNVAFFPLLPWLTRYLAKLGLSIESAGLLVVAVSALAAAWGIYAVGAELHSRRLGIMLAILWGALPHAIVENMLYAESLFTALAAWALWALLRRHWLLAAGLTVLAGLTRPTAAALIAAVGLTCLVAVIRRRDSWRPWVAGAVAPLGLIGFWAWVGWKLGRADGWFWMQREGWNSRTDFGRTTIEAITSTLYREHRLAVYATAVVVLVALALLVVLILDRRWPLPIVVYSLVAFAVVVIQGGGYFYAKGRFLLPAFTLLIPVGMALARASRTTRYTVLVTLTVLSAWYGAYLIIIWGRSP